MPTAAGQGAIPINPPPEAAGKDADPPQFLSREAAADKIPRAETVYQIEEIVLQIQSLSVLPEYRYIRTILNDARAGRRTIADAKQALVEILRPRGARRRRTKRKHFRKRTSRRT